MAENGCLLNNKYHWVNYQGDITFRDIKDCHSERNQTCEFYPAYDILNDICVKYAKEFFGEKEGRTEHSGAGSAYVKGWDNRTTEVFYLLQAGKKQEAEDYIWKHCLFNKSNQKQT